MSIEKLTKDLAIISKMGDYPGSDDGLTNDEFKAKFDEAALALKEHLNMLIDEINALFGLDYDHAVGNIAPRAIELTPESGVSHGGYIDFHYSGNTDDYTTRIIESSPGTLAINDKKILTRANITALYSVLVTFSNGTATYSHADIKSTSVCIVQRRSSTAGSSTTSMFGTTSNDGSVTIVMDNKDVTTTNLNILVLNL